MSDSMIPVTDEQAKAVQGLARLGELPSDASKDAMRAIAWVLGTNPEDFAGLAGGDWLRLKRAKNFMNIESRARARLEAEGVRQPVDISLSLALPLLEALADENRDELADLWAKLLAAAMDPARSRMVRARYVAILKTLEPIDAVVFQATRICFDEEYNVRHDFNRIFTMAAIGRLENGLVTAADLARFCGLEQDLVEISSSVLAAQDLITIKEVASNTEGQYMMISPTALGRSLLKILGS